MRSDKGAVIRTIITDNTALNQKHVAFYVDYDLSGLVVNGGFIS